MQSDNIYLSSLQMKTIKKHEIKVEVSVKKKFLRGVYVIFFKLWSVYVGTL